MTRPRVAILISGRGSNMMSLIEAAAAPDFPAEIAVVISNRPDAHGLARAQAANIPTRMIDHKAHADRAGFDAALHAVLVEEQVDLVCLAGFMRLLMADFTQKWYGRMINIHPALLPSFKGLHTHERALAEGVRIHGCTVHFVTPEMDVGPILMQAAVPVLDADTPDTLGARVLAQEHVIYPAALRLVVERRATLREGRVVIDEFMLAPPALVVPPAG
ncbi:phosphoribosylglycinamide formyltransferase-1 [Angulomicrobium tetraedrale]|uniref:Phosphoribosylglycinamide formyltransferase n=1 Tax=Ancylobacter tetraedralis TaxID=217068 RepID=A0A839Z790_9HYPH|nr:phosphoribosylglycinamide formyltransferase [Ancylobacter tetraedralis]MBB3770296.1 phosphoribosylglycinamide formyltransferase-1 [Ancylobacter tetraedralis]